MTTLLVASAGGHCKQLHHLHRHDDRIAGPYRWVTFDTPQTRSMLAGEDVRFVRPVASRDLRNAVLSLREAASVTGAGDLDMVVSTGAGIAVPYLGAARARGVRCMYIESAARSDGPSMTGRMLARVPGVELFTQYESWAGDRWQYRGSVFDTFSASAPHAVPESPRVLVTLGSLTFPFARLIDRLLAIVPAGTQVTWQVGSANPLDRLGSDARTFMPERELRVAMEAADVVVAHAGVGSALTALEAGRRPVLVPRAAAHGEHVDDHQLQIARELESRGLAVVAAPEALALTHLREAASRDVERAH